MTLHLDDLTLDAFVEGELPPIQMARVETHLAECMTCRSQADRLRQPAALLRRLSPEAAPADLSQRIVQRIARQRRWLARRLAVLSSAASLLGVALIAFSLSEIGAALARASTAANLGTWNVTISRLMELPLETLSTIANGTLAWESALAESAGVGLVLGLVLLTAAAFGGLARAVASTAPSNHSG